MKAIYTITNTVNNKIYVGSTKNFEARIKSHLSDLRGNRHHCIHLQRSFNKHGEQSFVFSVYKEILDDSKLFIEEQAAIDLLKPHYNIGTVGGGDNISNNPNREAIVEKMKLSLKNRFSKLSKSERSTIYGKPGISNPNWRGGHKYFCSCGAKIAKTSKTCFNCKSTLGELNPFFGKTHSEETKEKFRKARLGNIPSNALKVYAEGVIYSSLREAGDFYDINPSAMKYRVDSKSDKWKEFYKLSINA